jgi:hypothetical protein
MVADDPLRVDEVQRRPIVVVEGLPDLIVVVHCDRVFDRSIDDRLTHQSDLPVDARQRPEVDEHDVAPQLGGPSGSELSHSIAPPSDGMRIRSKTRIFVRYHDQKGNGNTTSRARTTQPSAIHHLELNPMRSLRRRGAGRR